MPCSTEPYYTVKTKVLVTFQPQYAHIHPSHLDWDDVKKTALVVEFNRCSKLTLDAGRFPSRKTGLRYIVRPADYTVKNALEYSIYYSMQSIQGFFSTHLPLFTKLNVFLYSVIQCYRNSMRNPGQTMIGGNRNALKDCPVLDSLLHRVDQNTKYNTLLEDLGGN